MTTTETTVAIQTMTTLGAMAIMDTATMTVKAIMANTVEPPIEATVMASTTIREATNL